MSESKTEVPVEVPAYDPAVHSVEDNPVVRIELYCECGGLLRWGGPAGDRLSNVLVQLRDFETRHHGPGHGPVTAAEALGEREARRMHGFRAAGRQAEYEPKEHDPGSGDAFAWTPTPPPTASTGDDQTDDPQEG